MLHLAPVECGQCGKRPLSPGELELFVPGGDRISIQCSMHTNFDVLYPLFDNTKFTQPTHVYSAVLK